MKIPSNKASAELGIHPLNLMLRIVNYGLDVGEIWPDIDSDWLDTLMVQEGKKPHHEHAQLVEPQQVSPQDSEIRRLVLDKLSRKKMWGGSYIPIEYLSRQVHSQEKVLERILTALEKEGKIRRHGHGTRSPISLEPSRKADIEKEILGQG